MANNIIIAGGQNSGKTDLMAKVLKDETLTLGLMTRPMFRGTKIDNYRLCPYGQEFEPHVSEVLAERGEGDQKDGFWIGHGAIMRLCDQVSYAFDQLDKNCTPLLYFDEVGKFQLNRHESTDLVDKFLKSKRPAIITVSDEWHLERYRKYYDATVIEINPSNKLRQYEHVKNVLSDMRSAKKQFSFFAS